MKQRRVFGDARHRAFQCRRRQRKNLLGPKRPSTAAPPDGSSQVAGQLLAWARAGLIDVGLTLGFAHPPSLQPGARAWAGPVRQQREGHREGPRAARLLRTQQNMLLCSTRGPHWKSTANGGGSGWRRQAVREISRPLLRNVEPSKANQTRKAAGGRASVFLEHGAKNQGRLQAPGAVGAGTALPSWCCRPCTVRAVVSVCRPKPKSLTWACAAPRWRRPAGRGAGPRFKNS